MATSETPLYFQRSYRIGPPMDVMNGFEFDLTISIYPEKKGIYGLGRVRQIEGPFDMEVTISGSYTQFCPLVMGAPVCTNFVDAKGFSLIMPGIMPFPGPECLVKLHMALDADWDSGTASYSFLYNGEWMHMENQEVKSVPVHTQVPETEASLAS